jgi:CTP synthase (UTP-ammonia lyase)
VVGLPEADLEETAPSAPVLVVTRLVCSLKGTEQEVQVMPGTLAFAAYGTKQTTEKFLCSFGFNEEYHQRMFGDEAGGGLRVAGRDAEGNVRIVERRSHPFFVATLFVPQLSSEPGRPHPLLVAFVKAAREFHEKRRDESGSRAEGERRAEGGRAPQAGPRAGSGPQ